MMMETVNSFETSVDIYQTTWCNIPEDRNLLMCAYLLQKDRIFKRAIQLFLILYAPLKYVELH
jgi:hypothetical protein